MKFILYAILISMTGKIQGARILGFCPMPFGSHLLGYKSILLELARRGHDVTLYSPYIDEGDLPDTYHQVLIPTNMSDIELSPPGETFTGLSGKMKYVKVIWKLLTVLNRRVSMSEEFQKLMNSDLHFDLIMMEMFHQEPFVALGHRFNAPVVGFFPVTPHPSLSKWAGNPYSFSTIPNSIVGVDGNLDSLWNRFQNVVIGLMHTHYEEWSYLPQQRELLESAEAFKYANAESRPSLDDMLRQTALVLIFSDSDVLFPRSMVKEFVEVSGVHIKESKLPEDLETIMNDSIDGVIFVSFGTYVTPEMLSMPQVEKLMKVFSRMPQTILWKYDTVTATLDIPKNIILRRWFPQIAILAHPKCKLFITHGGIHSILEAVHYAVPILGMPFFADQPMNLYYAREKGYGLRTDFQSFTEESIEGMLHELLNNDTYKQKAEELSRIYHDKRIPPMELAISSVEKVLANPKLFVHLGNAISWPRYIASDGIHVTYSVIVVSTILLFLRIKQIIIQACLKLYRGVEAALYYSKAALYLTYRACLKLYYSFLVVIHSPSDACLKVYQGVKAAFPFLKKNFNGLLAAIRAYVLRFVRPNRRNDRAR